LANQIPDDFTALCPVSVAPHRLLGHSTHIVHSRGDTQVKQLVKYLVKQPMQHQEISYLTWSAKGIHIVYSDSMVVNLSAEDMYPLAVPANGGVTGCA
jgi:hypothetical protein